MNEWVRFILAWMGLIFVVVGVAMVISDITYPYMPKSTDNKIVDNYNIVLYNTTNSIQVNYNLSAEDYNISKLRVGT